jgi:acyl-coenzyme A synthetase/AMP-(fatty) acid ligase
MLQLATLITHTTRSLGRIRSAVVFEQERLTWREFEARVSQLRTACCTWLGVRKGDRVATVLVELPRTARSLLGRAVDRRRPGAAQPAC